MALIMGLANRVEQFISTQSPISKAGSIAGTALAIIGVILGGVCRFAMVPIGVLLLIAPVLTALVLPRCRKGRLGIVLALHCESQEEWRRLQSDFVFRFKELARSGVAGKLIDVILLNPHWATRALDQQQARQILGRTHARYLLGCRARKREVRGETLWFLDLRGIVSHGKVTRRNKEMLEKEFKELLPSMAVLRGESDVLDFEMEAAKTEIVSRYIIAIALYLSHELDLAESLYKEVSQQLPDSPDWRAGKTIRQRLPMRYSEVSISRAGIEYHKWLRDKAVARTERMRLHLDKVPSEGHSREDYIFLRAIQLFLTERDASKALTTLKESRQQTDHGWRFSYAFLRAASGDLQAASRAYKKLSQLPSGPPVRTLFEVEEFLYWLQDIPEYSFIASFCLGALNRWIKRDALTAISELERFILDCPENQFKEQKKRVRAWIGDLRAQHQHQQGS